MGPRAFQEFNPGLFLTWERGVNYSIGAYYNSYERCSVLGSVGYDVEVTRDLVSFLGLQARYRNVFLQFIPADGDSLLTFGLTFGLE
jgi:hypothetical protein